MSKSFDLDLARLAVRQKNILWRRHALERMLEREFSREIVLQVVLHGEVIEDYSADRPVPSALMLGWEQQCPVHVVISIGVDVQAAVITVYEPTLEVFESDFRTRRKP
ncbi:MAG: DUF4258 domain-containing protein [Leptolinea sp.]